MDNETRVRRRNRMDQHEESPRTKDNDSPGSSSRDEISSLFWVLILLVFYSSLMLLHLALYTLPPIKKLDSAPKDFSEERARHHLESIVEVGSRPAGSYQNDVYAVKYIQKSITEIQSKAHESRKIEVDVQRPTGSFTLNSMGSFSQYYSNISNTVVKISSPTSSEQALLLNCHTDTFINSPGASDDAVACAIMLEILRAVAVDNTPLIHPLILLFNGAEENILQASHGFITQHKWAEQVQAFINLEAAGAGGKENVFQTGPENPWLVWAWARNAPHPHGSSVGQDLFQSGLIPSDTDFRIYRDYGKIPGIDLAYIQNGYVYHTYHDSIDRIQPGCIQRAGDNILGVVKHLVQSPDSLLADPSAYRHGEAAYFDFLGLFFVVIPMRLMKIINWFGILSVMAYIGKRMLHPRVTGFNSFQYNSKLLKAIAVNILSYTICVASLASLAGFLTMTGHAMSWYSHPNLIIGLYMPTALLALVTVHYSARKTIFKNEEAWKLEGIFFDAVLIMWTSMLFQLRNVGSSHLILLFVLFPVIGRGLITRHFFNSGSGASTRKKIHLYLLVLVIPTIFWIANGWLIITFFIPITGRSGAGLSPDIMIFALFGIFALACFSFPITTAYLVKSWKYFCILMIGCLACSLTLTFSDYGFPYRGEPSSPTKKRIFMQHVSREFYDSGGQLNMTDAGMFVGYLDYIGNDYHLGSDLLMEHELQTCRESQCEMPLFFPIQKKLKTQNVPVPPPTHSMTTDLYPFTVKWDRLILPRNDDDPDTLNIRLHFYITGPPHMSLDMAPIMTGPVRSTLVAWSFDGDIELSRSKYSSAETFFVKYGGGVVHPVWQFWLQFATRANEGFEIMEDAGVLEIAIAGHYVPSGAVSKVNRQTPELEEITTQLNDWIAPTTLVSLYKKYIV